ncbi:MAG: CPBP family intramembrane glutamic endopeptidase [Chloroflexota bacterium]
MSSNARSLKPMPFSLALLYFGIPAIVFVLSVYYLIPFFMDQGITEFMSYSLSLLMPLIMMLIASLIALRMEGYPVTWAAIKDRFRLKKMDKTDWVWTAASFIVMMIGAGIFGVIGQVLVLRGIIPLPSNIPTDLLDPTIDPANLLNIFAASLGPNAKGNWGLLVFSLILLAFNIIGEEFWWRGVVLPRQELVHGKNTWLIHGTLWALFHAFKYWSWLGLLPVCLALSFIAQKRRNTWPGIITHFVVNSLSLFPILSAIL